MESLRNNSSRLMTDDFVFICKKLASLAAGFVENVSVESKISRIVNDSFFSLNGCERLTTEDFD
jgi:hypothetical protein